MTTPADATTTTTTTNNVANWKDLRRRSVSIGLSPNGQWEALEVQDGTNRTFFARVGLDEFALTVPKDAVVASPEEEIGTDDVSDEEEEDIRVAAKEEPSPRQEQEAVEAAEKPPSTSTSKLDETQTPLSETVLTEMSLIPGNGECVDCGAGAPTWASVSHGCVLCMTCAGLHRGLGVHISRVRSLTLDNWTPTQVEMMRQGGNAVFKTWMDEYPNRPGVSSLLRDQPIRRGISRYSTDAAALYRMRLAAVVSGEVPPESLPPPSVHPDVDGARRKFLAQQQVPKSPKVRSGGGKKNGTGDGGSDSFCALCGVKFTMVLRRHHCRACGKLVCGRCAPAANSKPLPNLYGNKPVRHCFRCYRSPFVDWGSFANDTNRRKTLGDAVKSMFGKTSS